MVTASGSQGERATAAAGCSAPSRSSWSCAAAFCEEPPAASFTWPRTLPPTPSDRSGARGVDRAGGQVSGSPTGYTSRHRQTGGVRATRKRGRAVEGFSRSTIIRHQSSTDGRHGQVHGGLAQARRGLMEEAVCDASGPLPTGSFMD